MGIFHPFVDDTGVRLIGVEAAGEGVATRPHAATLTEGRLGVLHGAMSLLLQDDDGQVQRGPLDQRRPRLPGRRARARLPARDRPGRIRRRHRRRGPRGPAAGVRTGGHHPRPRDRPRLRLAGDPLPHPGARHRGGAQPLRPRRQGREHRGRAAGRSAGRSGWSGCVRGGSASGCSSQAKRGSRAGPPACSRPTPPWSG